jgi:hypothetical protein
MAREYWNTPQYQALYNVPIETLGLSETAIKAIKRTGITTVGDCVDFFTLIGSGNTITTYSDLFGIMETEVKPKLEAHGYWPLDTSDD